MKTDTMTHNACYANDRIKYNYIVEWWQKYDANKGKATRLIDTFVDYTAYGAISQFEQKHYFNAVVIAVYRHSPCTLAEVE